MHSEAFLVSHHLPGSWSPSVIMVDLGAACWVAAYLIIIIHGFKTKRYAIPAVAVVLNSTWEALGAFKWQALFPMWHYGAVAWFFVDLVIVYQVYRFGRNQQTAPELKKHWFLVVSAGLLLALAGQYYFAIYNNDKYGLESAYLINLVMGILFISMFFNGRDASLPAYRVAWLKMLGTGLTSLGLISIMPVARPQQPTFGFIYLMFIACFVIDFVYIWLLHKARTQTA